MADLQPTPRAAVPVPPPDQHHAHVEHHGEDQEEIGHSAEAQHAAAEVVHLFADAPARGRQHLFAAKRAENRVGDGTRNTSGTLNRTPRTKPIVMLPVKNDATNPMPSMASPTSQ